jgi:hypothetical protein
LLFPQEDRLKYQKNQKKNQKKKSRIENSTTYQLITVVVSFCCSARLGMDGVQQLSSLDASFDSLYNTI